MLTIEIPSNSSIITSRWCLEQVRGTLHFLLYHRMQIPVPYLTLGVLVDQFKNRDPDSGNSFFLQQHRLAAVDTHEQVQRIVRVLSQVMDQGVDLEYAAISFGPNPILAKETYFIRLPPGYRDHRNESHMGSLQQTVARTMLTLITDENLSSSLNIPLALTNIHILLKVSEETSTELRDSDCLEEISCFRLPRSCKTFLIHLNATSEGKEVSEFISCSCVETEIRIFDDTETGLEVQCSQMTINEDVAKVDILKSPPPVDSLDSICSGRWFQLNDVIKGFKDVLSNGQKIWTS